MNQQERKLELARRVADELVRVYDKRIVAVGVHGSVARGEADGRSDIDLAVVTDVPDVIVERELRIDGVLVSLGGITAGEYLDHATRVRSSWAVGAGDYLVFTALYDPESFFDRVRAAHERALVGADERALAEAAAEVVFEAHEWLGKCDRFLEQGRELEASVALVEGLIAVSRAVGVLTRTTWTGDPEGVASALSAGSVIEGFSEPFAVATSLDLPVVQRLVGAIDALCVLDGELARRGFPLDVADVADFVALTRPLS